MEPELGQYRVSWEDFLTRKSGPSEHVTYVFEPRNPRKYAICLVNLLCLYGVHMGAALLSAR